MSLAPRVHLSASRGTARRGVADLAHRITRNRQRVKRDAPRGWASRTRLAVGVSPAGRGGRPVTGLFTTRAAPRQRSGSRAPAPRPQRLLAPRAKALPAPYGCRENSAG